MKSHSDCKTSMQRFHGQTAQEQNVDSYLKIIDFSVGCWEKRCTESSTMRRFIASKWRWYVNSLKNNYILNTFFRDILVCNQNYFTGMMTSILTIASKNVSNLDPSTVRIGFELLSALAPFTSVTPFDVSDVLSALVGIASKCCNNWYSEPVSMRYFTVHRIIKRALNVCQICILLWNDKQTEILNNQNVLLSSASLKISCEKKMFPTCLYPKVPAVH